MIFLLDLSLNNQNSKRPYIINNIEIIKSPSELKDGFCELKENLLEHYDFVALPKKLFKLFNNWYGVDFEISRSLKPDPTQNNKMVLDLYPGDLQKKKCFINFEIK